MVRQGAEVDNEHIEAYEEGGAARKRDQHARKQGEERLMEICVTREDTVRHVQRIMRHSWSRQETETTGE